MYNPQTTVDRIKEIRVCQRVSSTLLNESCNLNKNTIATSANSKNGLSAKILFDIAETLKCSVDYLLGRDNYANSGNSINTGDIHGDHNATITTSEQNSEIEKEISSILAGLNFREKTELMTLIYKFVDEHKK